MWLLILNINKYALYWPNGKPYNIVAKTSEFVRKNMIDDYRINVFSAVPIYFSPQHSQHTTNSSPMRTGYDVFRFVSLIDSTYLDLAMTLLMTQIDRKYDIISTQELLLK